jgi:hypothetical protein
MTLLNFFLQAQPMFADFGASAIIGIIGLALSAAGTAAQMSAQNKTQRAQDQARAAELYRQSQYSKRAGAVVDQQIEDSSAAKAKPAIAEAGANRAAVYNRITSQVQPKARAVTQTVNSSPFAAATAQQSALAEQWNKIIGGAQSRIGGMQDWGLKRNIAQQRAAGEIDLISRNANASAVISDTEQNDAKHAGDGLAAGGDLLNSAGNLVSAYGKSRPSQTTTSYDPYATAAWGQEDWSNPTY